MTSRDSSVLAYGQPSLLHPWPYLSIVSECCRTRARQLLVSIAVEVSELRGVAFYLVSCCTEKCAIPVMNDSSLPLLHHHSYRVSSPSSARTPSRRAGAPAGECDGGEVGSLGRGQSSAIRNAYVTLAGHCCLSSDMFCFRSQGRIH